MSSPASRTELSQRLQTNPFFAGLDGETLQELAKTAVWRQYDGGEIVVLEGEAAAGLYYLQYGWLKAVKISLGGREQILRLLEPGETFNEVGLFTNLPNPATAIALEAAGVWLIRREAIMQLIRQRPEFAQHVLNKMARRLLHLVSLVTDLSLRPVTGRLARLILEEAQDGVLQRPRWYTQSELAARLGTVPDVVQRALRTLEKEGLIEAQRRSIRIINREGLTAAAE